MLRMQKIYKQSRLESRFALAFAFCSSSIASTSTITLLLLDATNYLPITLLAAICVGLTYSRFGRVYETNAGAVEIMPILALNLAILAVFLLLYK